MVMFLLGLVIGGQGIFANYQHHLPLFTKILWISMLLGILLNGVLVFSITKSSPEALDHWAFIGRTAGILGGITHMGTYISGFILLYHKGKFKSLFTGFSYVGRLALTNYLMHSLISLLIFRSVGLGLYGKIEVWQGILLTILIFVFQIAFSAWW
jgi:uncharacterized protein